MLELLNEIKEVVAIISSLLVGMLVLIIKLINSVKSKTNLNNLIRIHNKVLELVSDAEGYVNYNGQDKKEWVKTKVNQFCIENKITYDDMTVDKIIESLIELSKSVNKREKDKGILI